MDFELQNYYFPVGPVVEYLFSTGEQIRKASASVTTINIIAENSGLDISGLDVDARAQHVYWTTGMGFNLFYFISLSYSILLLQFLFSSKFFRS